MINLVPPSAHRRIKSEYWVRVVTVWLWLFVVAAVSVGVFLLPAYVLVTSQVSLHSAMAKEALERLGDGAASSKPLVVASEQARLLSSMARLPRLTELVEVVDEATPSSQIAVTSYAIPRAGDVVGAVKIEGQAATRLSLVEFHRALEEHPLIVDADLPLSNFSRDRDIEFSITLTIASSTPTP